MAIKALALDFDGVLVGLDTHTQARKGAFDVMYQETGDERYIVGQSIHDEAHEHGSHPSEIIGWILQHQGLVAPDADLLTDPLNQRVVGIKTDLYHSKVANELDALPGSLEFIEWGRSHYGSNHLSIVTTASIKEVGPYISRYQLTGTIGHLVTKEDTPIGQEKAHPFAYNRAVQLMGVSPENVAAIEDSVRGLNAANAALLGAAIGITTTHTADKLMAATPHIVHTFEELPYLLERL